MERTSTSQPFRAVNIADLTGWAQEEERRGCSVPLLLLRPILLDEVIHCEGERWDGDSLLVDPDIDPGRWDAIYTLIRDGLGRRKGIHKHLLRIYEAKNKENKHWKRI